MFNWPTLVISGLIILVCVAIVSIVYIRNKIKESMENREENEEKKI